MSKDKLTDYDATASNNTDIGGISIAEGMLPSAVNNSLREQMSHLKEALGSGTPLYVDQTNNRLGVGTVSPNNPLEIAHTGDAAAGGLRIGDPSTIGSDTGIYLRTTGDAVIGAAGGNIVFDTNMAVQERFRITDNGVTFNGDTAAANALDDYEEGTWTPNDQSGASLSFTAGANANYIKIGRLVLFNFYVTYPSTSSSATAQIGGLPYTVISSGFFYANYRAQGLGANNLLIQLNQGSTVMSLYNADAGYSNATLSSAYFIASGSYMTS